MTSNRASEIGKHLPFLRRYARAITGSQDKGDSYAAAALEVIIADTEILDSDLPLKVALYRVLYQTPLPISETDDAQIADKRLAELAPPHRAALLLHSIEEFSLADVASIMSLEQADVFDHVITARNELTKNIAGHVMIIEDEALIAMDLKTLVSDQGHTVTGIARTRVGAVELGLSEKPDLILADIRLADDSSGVDAVNDLLTEFGEIPVIFVTAYPEILLTGKRPEPAFLITKPYTKEQIQSAVSQAMFFASSDGIVATR